MTEGTGERVGGYRVVRRLAIGATSEVLLAKADGPLGFERSVVLKLLLAQYTQDSEIKAMFAREAAAYARLSHPSIVRLYDFLQHKDQLVMVLEYIDGPPLSRLRGMLKAVNEQFDDPTTFYVAGCIFDALAAAHAANDDSGAPAPVIHRDVNPSNVLIPWDAHVKLADFGVAKVTGLSHQSSAGLVKGTYGYMAPEQVKGETVTPRADVYAGGIVLWEMLTKRRAFIRGALPDIEVLRELAEPRIVSIDVIRPDVDKSVRDALKRALEPRAEKRTMTAEEMVYILRAVTPSEEGRERLGRALSLVRHEPQPVATSMPPPMNASDEQQTGKVFPRGMLPARPAALPRPTPAPRPAVPMRTTAPYGQQVSGEAPGSGPPGSAPGVPRPPGVGPALAPPRPRTKSQEVAATLTPNDLMPPTLAQPISAQPLSKPPVSTSRSTGPESEPGLASILEPSQPRLRSPGSEGGPAAAKVSLFDSLVEPPELVQTTGRESEKLRLGTPLAGIAPGRPLHEAIDEILQHVPSNVPHGVFPTTDPPREIGHLPAPPPPLHPVADMKSTLLAEGAVRAMPSSFPVMNKTLAMYERVDVHNPTPEEVANAEKMTARPPAPEAVDTRTAAMPAVEPPNIIPSTAKNRAFVMPQDALGSTPPPGGAGGPGAAGGGSSPPATLPLGGMTPVALPPIGRPPAPPPAGPPPSGGPAAVQGPSPAPQGQHAYAPHPHGHGQQQHGQQQQAQQQQAQQQQAQQQLAQQQQHGQQQHAQQQQHGQQQHGQQQHAQQQHAQHQAGHATAFMQGAAPPPGANVAVPQGQAHGTSAPPSASMAGPASGAPAPHSTRPPPARSGRSLLALTAMLLVLIAAGVAGTVGYVRWQKAKSAAVGPSLASTATGTAPGAGSLATSTTSRSPFVTPEGSGEVRASTSASANANADAGRNGDASTNGDAGGASAAGDASASAVSAATSSAATTDAGVDARAATPLEAGVVATADDIPAGMGRVKTEGTVPGRRIFVDERTVGQTPESVLVKCGARNVKLGSTGFVRSVEVPCGGEIVIGDR